MQSNIFVPKRTTEVGKVKKGNLKCDKVHGEGRRRVTWCRRGDVKCSDDYECGEDSSVDSDFDDFIDEANGNNHVDQKTDVDELRTQVENDSGPTHRRRRQ